MNSGNIQTTTAQKDWDDFFAGWNDPQDALDAVDSYEERVRVACELSGRQIKKTTERLDEPKKETVRVTVEFEFDR
ncbi:MAG: hypothetical protein EBZ61_09895 [Micrococcales bacterium]|nr:hypothetical protein [Micrococcales bacterium]